MGFGSWVHIPAVPLIHGGTLGQYLTPELQGAHLQRWRYQYEAQTNNLWVAGFLTFYDSM